MARCTLKFAVRGLRQFKDALRSKSGPVLTAGWLTVLLIVPLVLSYSSDVLAEDAQDDDGSKTLTLIQIGDLHGHMVPRWNLRSDAAHPNAKEGGLARIYTLIQQIRSEDPRALLVNTGDTVQGSAEALFTRGQAMVDVLDRWKVDAFALGNWDFLYGPQRTFELWGPGTGPGGVGRRWGAVAANAYCTKNFPGVCAVGERPFPPYMIKTVNGIKIGILGFTTQRGIPALAWTTAGFKYTGTAPGGLPELPYFIDVLRNQEHVDMIVMISELGLGNNVFYTNKYPGVDVVLSSDMHEITPHVVVGSNGTLVSEAGQDGTKLAEYHLKLGSDGKVKLVSYTYHTISSDIPPNPAVAAQVRAIRAPYVRGPRFVSHTNPFSGAVLNTPVDTVVGMADQPLYRGNFSNEDTPGVLEGTSHDFISDVFRDQAQADIGTIRGFRYGTHVRPGPIELEDIYHFIPVGPMIAKATITGQQLKSSIENGADGALSPDVTTWSGGWVFGFSGVTYDLDPYKGKGSRASNIKVTRWGSNAPQPLDLTANYTVSGYFYKQDPTGTVGAFAPAPGTVSVLTGPNGETLDGTDVVVNYLKTQDANPQTHRVNLLYPLPAPVYGNPEIQPLKGVPTIH